MESLHQLRTWTGVSGELFYCAFQAQRCLLLFLDEMHALCAFHAFAAGRCLVPPALIIKPVLPEWPSA